MKTYLGFILLLISILYIDSTAVGQNVKAFNTLTFFYIDNSEGYTSDDLNASLSQEVVEELKKKLNSVISKPDNYFFLIASNGSDVKQSSNAATTFDSEWLKKYLSRTSKEADYAVERQVMRDNFSLYPVRIKKEIDVHIYLSAYALSQLSKRLEELPMPLFFPRELPLYLNNPEIQVNLKLYSNKVTIEKLGADNIQNQFTFCNSELGQKRINIEIIPL